MWKGKGCDIKVRIINGFVVCEFPGIEELKLEQIDQIVSHTHNTWQPNRPIEEIRKNTIQGKCAEFVVEKYLKENSGYRYESYDDFRIDDFEKHAPFDGIIYSASIGTEVLRQAKSLINYDVIDSYGDTGTITVETRNKLEDNGIFTVEIKSSLLQDPRDYRTMEHKNSLERTDADYTELCEYIKGFYDYFVYPNFCRNSMKINSFYDYVVYYRMKHQQTTNTETYLFRLIKTEFDNACNIYTRVFIDMLSNEILIPGYVTKSRFFEEPRIRKMKSDKSKNAVYYMYHMRDGNTFIDIDSDPELREYSRLVAYNALFTKKKQECSCCGKRLELVESRKNHKFLYHCNLCGRWYTLNTLYPTNMEER